MGREVKRVPLDFVFPVNASYHDAVYEQHCATCYIKGDDDHDVDTCGGYNDDPPVGEGWQLWQTVSDGPVTPVFATPEALIDWMSQPVPESERPRYDPDPYPSRPAGRGWRRKSAERIVRSRGYIPSGMAIGGRLLTNDELVAEFNPDEEV